MVSRILCLLAVLSACSIDAGKFDDRRCQSDVECRPDESCRESLCAQETCTVSADCGPGYQYECEVGGCVATACTSASQCDLGFSCTDGFCATECAGADADMDGICDAADNCITAPNRNQTDTDDDLRGDACDTCPADAENDGDNDTICGDLDNCKFAANTSQLDRDNDGMGNECDGDDDADGQIDTLDPASLNPDLCGDSDTDTCDDCTIGTDDLGPLVDRTPSNDGPDTDTDGACNAGDPDDDNDGRNDGLDRCPLGENGWMSSAATDNDSDGCRDATTEDLDDDNDGLPDLTDPMPLNPNVCGDSDGDTCDDCAVGSDNFGPLADRLPAADGPDADADGACNAGDLDDDNDGVSDLVDPAPLNPDLCGDSDSDTCDDCVTGTDDFGPLPDNLPAMDGPDPDGDGACSAGDPDDDNDGVADALDIGPVNPMVCGDSDMDVCDDCAVGADGFGPLADSRPAADGLDTDSDGRCNVGDPDDDNDGVGDATDTSILDPRVCADSDMDLCDDCAVGSDQLGPLFDFAPQSDGTDSDSDGSCNVGDPDDDNDGVFDATDPSATNPAVCGDTDSDTCDDCAIGMDGFGPLLDSTPSNDGPDHEPDGLCDAGDPDDDNDSRLDAEDLCPLGVTGWTSNMTTDNDRDGCRDAGEDCNPCIPTCGANCMANGDADGAVDCIERFCGSDPATAASTCVSVATEAELTGAINAANTSAGHDYVLLNASFTVAGDLPNIAGTAGATFKQCIGTTVTVNDGLPLVDSNRTLFEFDGSNSVVDGVRVANGEDGHIMFRLDGPNNTVRNSTIAGYERIGVLITGANNAVHNNVIRGGNLPATSTNAGAVVVNGSNADFARIVSNVIVQTTTDGIRVIDGDDVLIDHNTISFTGGDAVSIDASNTVDRMCMRNNVFSNNPGAALEIYNGSNYNWSTACADSLTGGKYGNTQFANTAACGGSECGACSCLTNSPISGQANFFEFTVNPSFASTTFGQPEYFCVMEATLIDSMDVVDGDLTTSGSQPHDLNGREPGLVVGPAPDGGGRESGAEGCP